MSETNLVPWPLRIVQIGSEGIAIKPDSGDLRIDAKTLAMCSSCALALLFAAAPDMLAALKVAQHSLRAWNAMGMSGDVGKQVAAAYENSPEMKVIAAAIAKAGTQ